VCRNKGERERIFRTKLNIFPLPGLYFLQTLQFAVVIILIILILTVCLELAMIDRLECGVWNSGVE